MSNDTQTDEATDDEEIQIIVKAMQQDIKFNNADALRVDAEDLIEKLEQYGVDDSREKELVTDGGEIDLSYCNTAEEAAKEVETYLVDVWDAEDAYAAPPEKTENLRDVSGWLVSWASGPYEWAVHLMGGDSLTYGEYPAMGGQPEIVGFNEHDGWTAEPYHTFDIVFYEEEQ